MIDFQNGSVFKLGLGNPAEAANLVGGILLHGENIVSAFTTIRDWVVFTDKRIIAMNVQGMTGKKRDFTSLPYSKIQAWSVETAGTFDLDAELEMWFSGLGRVRLEFKGRVDVASLSQLIAFHVLG